mgnify:CR=1 FL=1
MEIDILNVDKKIDEKTARKSNPQMLAFIGDAVFSLYVRTEICLKNNVKANELHKLSTDYVKASGQSDFMERLLPNLNEFEMEVYKRARNYKTANIAKNAKVNDYKRATGLEALLGYLYLCGKNERLNEILRMLNKGENND